MDHCNLVLEGKSEGADLVDVAINLDCLVGKGDMGRLTVGLSVEGDSWDLQFVARGFRGQFRPGWGQGAFEQSPKG